MTDSVHLVCCNQYGSVFGTFDELSGQTNQAVVEHGRAPHPKQVSWNIFHVSVGHMGKALPTASAKIMGVTSTGLLDPCEACLAAR